MTVQESGSRGLSAAAIAVIVAVVGGVLLFFVTRFLAPAPMSGDIVEAPLSVGAPCCTYSVQVRLEGFQGAPCELRHIIVNADTGATFAGASVLNFTSEATADQARTDALVPLTAGNWYVRFILYDPDGVELDRLDTQVVNVSQ